MLPLCFVVAVVIISQCDAQISSSFHDVCHRNLLHWHGNQVTEMIAVHVDEDRNGIVSPAEALLFAFELDGSNFTKNASAVEAFLTVDERTLEQMLWGQVQISKNNFTQSWSAMFHDSDEFIGATFDALDAINHEHDGFIDGRDALAIADYTLDHYDNNNDGKVQTMELLSFLEHIFKIC